jgi:drug/metabolite transporter (DMT)-like permease
LASIFLKERANKWQMAGIVVALAAILLLSLETGNEGSPVTGWLWIVLAVLVLLAWGIQGFFMKFANESMDAESLFVYMALFAVVLAPVAYFMTPDAAEFFAREAVAGTFWSSFGIQILNSIGALTLVYAYRYGKAVVVSPMEGLAPMVTVLLSLVILHVIPNPLQIAGLVCAAFAMYALSK